MTYQTELPYLQTGLSETQKRNQALTEKRGVLFGSYRVPSKRNPNPITIEELNAWIELRKAGVSVQTIADKYNRHATTLRRKFAQLGIKTKLNTRLNNQLRVLK